MKKKLIIGTGLIGIILFLTVAIVAVLYIMQSSHKNNKSNNISETLTSKKSFVMPGIKCDKSKNDKEIYAGVIKSKDINQCECIKDSKLKDTCKQVVMDISFYDQALKQLDETLCERVHNTTQKDACYSVVKSSIEQLREKDPEYLARVYASSHNEKAIGELEKIIQQDKENIDAYITLALSYAEKGLNEQEQGRDQTTYVNKALQVIEDAKQIDDKNSEVYRVEGYAYEIKPDYVQSKVSYQKALELNSDNMLANAGLGHVYRMEGALELAVEEFNKAAELDKNKTAISIYTNLCNLEASRSNQEEAVKNCKIVTQIKEADPIFKSEALQVMAELLIRNKDTTQAKNYLLEAKTLTPNDPNLYVSMSRLNFYSESFEQAIINANKAIELSPTKATSYLALSRALYMQEKFQEAIEKAQKGISLVKDDVSLLLPSKPAVKRDLNYVIANSYRQLRNTQKQQEYEQKAKEAFDNFNSITQ